MAWIPPQIEELVAKAQGGVAPSVRFDELLGWFNASRPGARALRTIADALDRLDLVADPSLETAVPDATITLRARLPGAPHPTESESPPSDATSQPRLRHTAFHVKRLKAATCGLVSVNPEAPLREAITKMDMHDFSQLPVLRNEWDCLGYVSWKTIGRARFHGSGNTVRECMSADFEECRADDNLFEVLDAIVRSEFVLVRGANRRFQGIITTTDLSEEFHALTEPFLLLSEVEGYLRTVLDRCFTPTEMREACAPDEQHDIRSAADLSFGAYVRLLQPYERYRRLDVPHDHAVIVGALDVIRKIRNSVMHFRPEGIDHPDLLRLRGFARVLRDIEGR